MASTVAKVPPYVWALAAVVAAGAYIIYDHKRTQTLKADHADFMKARSGLKAVRKRLLEVTERTADLIREAARTTTSTKYALCSHVCSN